MQVNYLMRPPVDRRASSVLYSARVISRGRTASEVRSRGVERSERTKDRLIRAAERLFGDQGINGVSLREINRRAGQRNPSALHYHFDDRDGLVRAIVRKHLHKLAARYDELLAATAADDRGYDLRSLAEIVVRPLAELIGAGASERAFVKIYAELITDPRVPIADLVALNEPVRIRVTRMLLERLPIEAPRDFLVERLFLGIELVMHAVADRARLDGARRPRRTPLPLPLFASNLADMFAGAISARMSDETATLLRGSDDRRGARSAARLAVAARGARAKSSSPARRRSLRRAPADLLVM
jgi:AcrR family transcriptional regulator